MHEANKMSDICDHDIRLTRIEEIKDQDGNVLEYRLHFEVRGEAGIKKICKTVRGRPTDYLGSREHISDLESEGVVFNGYSNKHKVWFRSELLRQYRNVPKTEKTYITQGVSNVDGTLVCVLGEELISAEEGADEKFTVEDSKYHLHDVPPDGSLLSDVIEFMQIGGSLCLLLVMYVVFSVLQGYLPLMGIQERFMLVVEGKTSAFKSTVAKIVGDVFKEKTVITLASSKASIQEVLSTIGHVPTVLDDYNKSSFSSTTRAKGAMLSEFIQAFPERNPVQKMVGRTVQQYQIKCGIIVTAEEMPKNPSTLNRCLIAAAEEDISPHELEKFQQPQKHVFSALVRELNKFIICNFAHIKEAVGTNFHTYRSNEDNFPHKPESVAGYYRINTTYSLSMVTVEVFRSFLLAKQVGADIVEKECSRMKEAVREASHALCDRLSEKRPSREHIDTIYQAYDSEWSLRCAKSPKKYYANLGDYIGIEMDDIFYVRGEMLLALLKGEGLETTKQAFSKELRFYGLLQVDSDGKSSVHLPDYSKHRERFYAIKIYELQELTQKFFDEKYGDVLNQVQVDYQDIEYIDGD